MGRSFESISEDAILHAAEAHFNLVERHPEGGVCRDCVNFRGDCLRALPSEDGLEGYGVCIDCGEDPQIVPADEWHDWDECWYDEHPSEGVRDGYVRSLVHNIQHVRKMHGADYASAFSLRDEDGTTSTNVMVMRGEEVICSYRVRG